MINSLHLGNGVLEPVPVVAKSVTGRRPSPATIWRWCRKGLAGGRIKLEWVFHGGQLCTTEAAFREFIAAQTANHEVRAIESSDPADETLIAAGLL